MKKTALSVILILFAVSTTAIHSPEHDTLKVQGEISQGDKNFYPQQRIVEFPAVKGGEETVKYSNASYEEYISWQVKDKGLQEIRSELKTEISLNGIRTGSTAESIEITYIQNESIDRNYTYQQLQELAPSKVKGTYEIQGKTVNAKVPVKLGKKKDTETADRLDYSVAKASESFGSSSGENYNASFNTLNVTQGELMGEQVRNVSVSENSISFTGYVELPQPCNKIKKTYEKTDSELVLKVDTYSTGEPCIDVIAFKKYSFSIESEEPIRLEVRHNGQEVRTVQTPEPHSDEAGIIAEIVNLIQNLF